MDTKDPSRKSGQALVEFCVCLLGLLAVIGGIFILGDMCLARTDARVEATRIASNRSMTSPVSSVLFVNNFIRHVSEGGDGQRYSEDDFNNLGGALDTFLTLSEPNQPNVLRRYAPLNILANIQGSTDLGSNTAFVSGQDYNQVDIRDFPIIRKLFVNQNTVDIDQSVWSVRTGDLY